MAMFGSNNDAMRDRDLLGARVNPSDEHEPEPEVDPSALPEWMSDEGVFFEDAPAVNESLQRASGSEADVVEQFREEELDEPEYDEQG